MKKKRKIKVGDKREDWLQLDRAVLISILVSPKKIKRWLTSLVKFQREEVKKLKTLSR